MINRCPSLLLTSSGCFSVIPLADVSQVGSEDTPASRPPYHFFSFHFALFTSYVIISFLGGRGDGGGAVWVGGAWSRVRANREGSFSLSLPPSTPQPLQRAEGNYRGSGKLEQRASRQRGRAGRDPGWPRRYRAQNKTESGRGKGLLSEWEGRIAYIEIDWSKIGKKQVNSVRRKNSNLIMDV